MTTPEHEPTIEIPLSLARKVTYILSGLNEWTNPGTSHVWEAMDALVNPIKVEQKPPLLSLDETADLAAKVDNFLVQIARVLETSKIPRVSQFTEEEMALWNHLKRAGLITREVGDREPDSPWDMARFTLTYKGMARLEQIKKARGEETERLDKILETMPTSGRLNIPPVCLDHKPVQHHRDDNPPWCENCGWTSRIPAKPATKIKDVN